MSRLAFEHSRSATVLGLLVATLLGLACAHGRPLTSPAADTDWVARARGVSLGATQFEREIESAARTRENLGQWRSDPALQRRFAEDWVLGEALAVEARRSGLARAVAAEVARAREDVLVATLERQLDAALPEPSASDVGVFLEAHRAAIAGAEKLRLRHVFRRVPRNAGAVERDAVHQALENLRTRILAGEDMGALARTHSESETAKFEGLMTPVARGQLPRSVEAIVWALGPGELSAVVDTAVGSHVFRLEGRQPPEPLDAQQAEAWARLRLRSMARESARKAAFERWREAAHAAYHPELLAREDTPPAAVLLRVGRTPLTAADLATRHAGLGFAERRTRTRADLLAGAAWRALALWQAGQLRLADQPDVRLELQQAERGLLARLAFERRLAALRATLPDEVLRAFFATAPERYADPARERLRVVVRRPAPGAPMHTAYDALAAQLGELRGGRTTFEALARRFSEDPSADQDGDLGFVAPRDLQAWAGPTLVARVADLAPGEIGGPLLAERYDEGQLAYVPDAYVLVRVETRRVPVTPRFEDVRAQVALAYASAHPIEVQEGLRATLLRELQAEVRLGDAAPR